MIDEKALDEQVARQDNISQMELIRDGVTVYHVCRGGFARGDAAHVMSVTKSVVSLLVGIALDQGLIQDVHQPVLDFFPDYHIKRGEKTIAHVTVEHLLTMTAPYKYKSEPWTKVCASDDWTSAALDFLGGRAGITGAFQYATLGIHILTGILAAVSSLPTAEFANRFLFEPAGIAPHRGIEAVTAQEHKAFIMSKAPKENVWMTDPRGVGAAGFGLCLSARDMARLGLLCLQGGTLDGKRIVSEKWIRESTRPRLTCDESFARMAYGYLWWTPWADSAAYAALGNSGNVIYVNPETRVVAAVSATFKPRVLDRAVWIRETIEPLLTCSA